MSGEIGERPEGSGTPDYELLAEVEVGSGHERLGADGLRVLDPVHGDVEIAPHQRGDEVAPVVLHEPLADAEALRQALGDEHLESFELRGVAGVAIDEGLSALEVARPGQFASRTDPVDTAGESGNREEKTQEAGANHEMSCEGSRSATQWPWTQRARVATAHDSGSLEVCHTVRPDGDGQGEKHPVATRAPSGNAVLVRCS